MGAAPTRAAKQCLTFSVGEERFAAHASEVAEVVRRAKITRVPNGPRSLLGVTSFRGAATPVVSLARLLGREGEASADAWVLMLDGETPIGLAVDRVGALATLDVDDAQEAGRARGWGQLFIQDEAALRSLDLDALLKHAFSGLSGGSGRGVRDAGGVGAEAEADSQTVDLLGFDLADQAYALRLEEVVEVAPLPTRLASPAQSDEAMLGVVDLRGRLLPIVSLRLLLGLPGEADRAGYVIVVRIGDAVVGLVVDRLRAILRLRPDAIDPAPAALNHGAGEAQVQTIARLPDHGGLVAILSGERLFREEKVARILRDGRASDEGSTTGMDDVEQREPFLIFRLADEEYGLPLDAVAEVVRPPSQLTRVPRAPAFIEGVLNLRGQVVPVIDQRNRFDAPREGRGAGSRIVVTRMGEQQVGFIVDAVSEILSLGRSQIDEIPELTVGGGRVFSRVAKLDGGERLLLLIDPKELLDRAEKDLLAGLDAARGEGGA